MTILYILSSTNRSGGATKSFLALISGLKEFGVSFCVVMPDKQGIYQEILDYGIHVFVLPLRFNAFPKFTGVLNKLLFVPRLIYWQILNTYSYIKLVHILHYEKVDIIHTNVGVVNVGFLVSKKLGIPHIYHIREYGDKDFNIHYFPNKKYFKRQLISNNSYSICITKDIQHYFDLQNIKASCTIYNGVNYFQRNFIYEAKEEYFLYVGRIEKAKGLDILLKAFCDYIKYSKRNRFPLIIVGAINDKNFYLQIVNFIMLNQLSNYVRFIGCRYDIAEFMRRSLAIVIPSRNEGFGRCMAEAMFNSCLVIGHNTGGLKEQFDNGRQITGEEIGLRYDTIRQLTCRLIEVANNSPETYIDMIKRAFSVVNKLYSTEACVENVFNLYKKILNERKC